jgi:hypothetical protein
MRLFLSFLFAAQSLITSAASAQSSVCGDPPPVANESLEGEIKGKAQLVTKFLGDAELAGKIKSSRSEIFSKYPNAEQSRANAYFEYQVCVLLMNDTQMSTKEKLNELQKIKREFGKPVSRAYPVILSARYPWIDNREIGVVRASVSSIQILIGDKTVVNHSLDEPAKDHEILLEPGSYSYSFIADVTFRDGVVDDTCRGTVTISGPATFSPWIVFYKRTAGNEVRGFIRECKLRPV